MESNKEKRKRNFAVMVVMENDEGKIQKLHFGAGAVKAVCAVLAVLLILLAGYGISKNISLSHETDANTALSAKVEALTQETKELQVENTELSEKVTLLSETVNDKVQKESEEAEKYVPTGFPLSGTATILEDGDLAAMIQKNTGMGSLAEAESVVAELTKEPIVHFSAAGGTAVVATGNGTVTSVADDTAYGKVLTIDHGNGYASVYRVAAEPKVKEGDELTKGTMLFEIGPDGGLLGYQIQQDKSYMDPLELMEISG